MIRENLKLFMYQKLKIKNDYTYQGVPQGRKKSRIGRVLRALLGDSMNTGSIQKVEVDRFTNNN